MKQNYRILSILVTLSLVLSLLTPLSGVLAGTATTVTKATSASEGFANYIKNTANQFVVVKHKQLGNSHYAYTNSVSDSRGLDQPSGDEYSIFPGSEMVLLTYDENNVAQKTEEVLLETASGIIRDPDISADGERLLYSYKANESDDFHLYEMVLDTRKITQLTFGQGISDTEGKYLPNGKIIFSSTRCIQTVDCWITQVANLYTCDADGKNIVRFGYDQVHTTYPTVTSDGRVLYTRWDYNDRNQMYVQAVFQMFPDGTNQTELFGNNTSFPTTLLHTTEIPGAPGKYYSIASGHHVLQAGKLCVIDTTVDRNEYRGDTDYATTFLDQSASGATYEYNYDAYGQGGMVYKFPVGISENELLVSMNRNGNGRDAQYGIYYTFVNEDGSCEYTLMSSYSTEYTAGASQIAPIPKTESPDFERPTMVNYAKNTGTYYVGNVYEGEAVKELVKPAYNEDGTVKTKGEVAALRVVEVEFRSNANGKTISNGADGGSADPYNPIATGRGSWDVKRVLGIVDVEDDGSALFEVPSETPVYFQLLNEEGEVLQTMRSWSTLMPGETFSCVGCHENKNSVPPAASTVTMAMKKGVQKLKAEDWMKKENSAYKGYDPYEKSIGFSYMTEVQPIFDKSCVTCHSDAEAAFQKIGSDSTANFIFEAGEEWEYTTSTPNANTSYATAHAPFGTLGVEDTLNTLIAANTLYLKKTFNVTSYELGTSDFVLNMNRTGTTQIKVNGTTVDADATEITLDSALLNEGENTIEVTLTASGNQMYFDATLEATNVTSIAWYQDDYDTSTWSTSGTGGFGGDWGSNKYNNADVAIKNTFNISNANNVTSMTMSIKYDEDPKVYINGRLVWSTTGWYDSGYTTIDLLSSAKSYLKTGTNTIAVSVTNNTGGKGLDLSLSVNGSTVIAQGASGWKYYDGKPDKQDNSTTIVASKSSWKYRTSSVSGTSWYTSTSTLTDWSWSSGNGLFGNDSSCTTSWSSNQIYLRKTFSLDQTTLDKIKTCDIKLSIFYDEDPHIYVNGTEIFTRTGYNTGYESFDITESGIKDALKSGTNLIAVSAINTAGGQFIDLSITASEKSDYPMSLEGILIDNATSLKQWPISYLLLTGSTSSGNIIGSPNEIDTPSNPYTTWMSSMSGSQIQPAKRVGSIASPIITMLQEDHQNLLSEGKLTETDIKAIATWIDLGVPLCGSYDELSLWAGNSSREAEEKLNKRTFYNDMNAAARKVLAGTVQNNGTISMRYIANGSTLASASGIGTVTLNVNSDLQTGHTVTVNLPKGEKYLAFRLDPRFEESIIYCPDSTFTYTVPEDTATVFPRVLQSDDDYRFYHLTMTARIPSADELKESYNLALNPYDLTNGGTVYPHVTTSSNYNDQVQFAGRNAIDGFDTNEGHDVWPYQSWGPNQGNGEWFNIDFGRSVTVDKLVLYTRADFPHDVNYVSATLEFSDGSTQPINLYKTTDAIEIALDEPTETESVKIKDLTTASEGWAGLAEVEVYGFDQEPTVADTNIVLEQTKAKLTIGETIQLAATVTPTNTVDKTVTWKSSDESIATVDANGKITAISTGKATITATTANGSNKSASRTVTVVEASEDGLLLHYDFASENIADNTVADLTGNGFDGTLVTSESSIDLDGDAITLNNNGKTGSAAAGVDLPQDVFSGTTDTTLSFWIRPEYNTARHDTLFSMGQNVNGNCGAILYDFEESQKLRLATNGNLIDDKTANATRGLAENEWQLLTYVTEGSTAKLYLNGQELLNNDQNGWNTLDATTEQGAYIGRSICWSDAAFVGSIGDFKAYSKALSVEEILAEYAKLAEDGYSFGAVKTDAYGYTHNTDAMQATAFQTKGNNSFGMAKTSIPYNNVGSGATYKIPLNDNAEEAYVMLTVGGNYTVAVENSTVKTVDPFLGASGNAGEIGKVVLDVSEHIVDGAVSITLSGDSARFYSAQICYDKDTCLGTQSEYGFRINSSNEAAYLGDESASQCADHQYSDTSSALNPVGTSRRFTDNNAYFTWKLPLNLSAAKQILAVYADGRDLQLKLRYGNGSWKTVSGLIQNETRWQSIDISEYLQAAQADASAVQGMAYVELMMADSATADGWGGCMKEIKVKSYYSITSNATGGTITITSDVSDDRAEKEYSSTAAASNRNFWSFSRNAADLSKGNTNLIGYTTNNDALYLAEGEKVYIDVEANANHSIVPGTFMGYRGDTAEYIPMRDGWRTDDLQSERHSIVLDNTTSGLEIRVTCKADSELLAEDAIGLIGHSINPLKNGLRSVYRIRKKVIDGEEYITVGGEDKKVLAYGVLLATESVVNSTGGVDAFDMSNPSSKIKYYDFKTKFANVRYDVADAHDDFSLSVINLTGEKADAKICARGYVLVDNGDGTKSYAYTKVSTKAYNDYV